MEPSAQRFRLAAERASDLIYDREPATGDMEWFGDIDGALGYDDDSFPRTYAAWREAIHPDDRGRVSDGIERALAEGAPLDLEYRVVRRDGTIRHWIERGAPLEGSPGGGRRWIGVATDVTARRESEERLARQALEARLLHRATALAAETHSFDVVLQACLDLVCELTGWPLGHAFVPEESGKNLVSSGIWHLNDHPGFARFRRATREMRFSRDAGLPGRIWSNGEPAWIADLSQDESFERGGYASRELGVKSAFGFPVRVNGGTMAVLEFFSPERVEPDSHLLATVRALGEQLKRVLERKTAQEAVEEQRRTLETVNRINMVLAGELNRETLVQAVTDAGRELTGAQFAAFFYNVVGEDGEGYMLYTLSGAPREAFSRFPTPRLSPLFAPTFRGEGVVRSDDVTRDPRYGKNPPHHGMPSGHLPVKSYLAIPVVSRSGTVLGGLFFGHERPAVFTEKAERVVAGIAAQAAIALDNAALYEAAQREIKERKRAQEQLKELNESLERRIAARTRSLVRSQSELRKLAEQLTLTEQRERRRLATELHDYLAQLLAVCKLKTAQLDEPGRNTGTDESRIRAELDEVLDEAITYTRTLMAKLSPTILYDSGLLTAVRWLAGQMKERHGLSAEVVAESDIPSMPEDQAVLVYQTIRELLTNVVKHAGVPEASVLLRPIGKKRDELLVRVEDRGAGFDLEDEKKLTSRGGYGLFSVGERIETMGGRFTLTSTPGGGTRAELIVPLQPAPPKPALPPRREAIRGPLPPEPTVGSASGPIRVLIADDHEMIREGLRSVIESCGDVVVVAEAADGEQAVELTRTIRPDVAVMDINMPRLNGIEATRRIRTEHPEVKVLGLSIHKDDATCSLMKRAGAVDYLTKGGSSDELCRAIRKAARRELEALRK